MKSAKKPLYRKVNTRARGVIHHHGSDYRKNRGKDSPIGMRQGVQRGLDYTPLYKFLLSKVGEKWPTVHSEALSRLDSETPLFAMVSLEPNPSHDVVRLGESSYFSGLYVDEDSILQIVDPTINEDSLVPTCKCCTHTFNGIPFSQKYPG